ncbi:MAG: tRNA (N(6)-L-threonylcarbamoyladenosine(37)-C(2))-methylthiotransferase MtaB [Lachnospiraceae bacterium]|nr:tRNA (N(6)-L-threonylcarbamoyladenosine(37)-C(2))-methylthiotransferase MtaB [Lachnospiraceae bacterium]
MPKVAFHNLGCKVNAYETEAMLQQLQAEGYEIVPFEQEADVYVINTCTVTNIADRKSRQMIHRAKRRNPDALVVAVGCYVQADPEGATAPGGADLIVGNDQKGRLAELIAAHTSSLLDLKAPREYEALALSDSPGHTRAFLKIQDGCNQFCSYCLIPYVRGRVRSRKPEEVLAEARRLSEKGFCEVVLTGIHLSSYGVDFSGESGGAENGYGTALRCLIQKLAEIPGIQRIRLGSLEPRIITEDFVQALVSCRKICPHFHLSLQSGCAATLARMNRKYTPEEYFEKCELLRRSFVHPAITTDVIVGFPGETEEEFRQTRDFLERVSFYEVHVFKYSRRKGTRADRMPDQVPEPVKAERSRILLEMTEAQAGQFRAYYFGQEAEVRLEEPEERNGETFLTGYTREYVRVRVPAEGHTSGETVTVTVTEENLA